MRSKFFGNLRKNHHLPGFELDQQGHQQALALDFLDLAVAQNFFKKNTFVCHMLVDDPQAVVAGGQDEGLAQLAEGPQRARWLRLAAACSASTWAAAGRCARQCVGSRLRPGISGLRADVASRRAGRSAAAAWPRRLLLKCAASRLLDRKGRMPGTGLTGRGVSCERLGVLDRASAAASRSGRRTSGAPGSGEMGTAASATGWRRGQNRARPGIRRPDARLIERVAQAVADKVVNQGLLAEADLGLGGMHVDVHFFGRHFKEEQHDRKAGGRNDVAIGLGDGVQQQAVADEPLVDEDVDGIAIELLQFGLGIEAAERAGCPGRVRGSSGSFFHGGGSGRPARSSGVSAATGSNCASVSLPKIW